MCQTHHWPHGPSSLSDPLQVPSELDMHYAPAIAALRKPRQEDYRLLAGIAHLAGCLPSIREAQDSIPSPVGDLVWWCNLKSQNSEVVAGGSEVQGHLQPCCVFEGSLSYRRPGGVGGESKGPQAVSATGEMTSWKSRVHV